MRRKSRTSCWSNPRRPVANAASATAAGDDGSGRENEMAIAAQRKRGDLARRSWQSSVGAGERVAAEALERGERLVERGDRDDLDVVAGDLAGARRSARPWAAGTRKCHAGLAHGRRLLRQPADRADGAVEVDRAGDGDSRAAGQVARRQLVDQRQRERQAGRRPADLAGVDVDLERQLDGAPCRTGRSR